MKDDKEKVLKFLAGLMTDEEKRGFETELNSSVQLKLLLEKYSKNVSDLKKLSEVELDESYFNTLIPKMRKKLDAGKNRSLIYRFAPAIPAVALSFFILINILYLDFKSGGNFDDTLAQLVAGSDSSTISEFVNDYSYSLLDDYSAVYSLPEDYYTEIELTEQMRAEVIDAYNLYENLSDEDVDYIYKSLIDKKIF